MRKIIIKRLLSLLPVLLLCMLSCGRIKRKSEQIADQAKEKIAEVRKNVQDKKEEWIEKFNPTYDYANPDTKYNKKRFTQYLEIVPSADVKNIYAYGDFLGADYKVLISFSCDQSTIDTIIHKKGMQPAGRKGGGLFFSDEFPWWDKNKIDSLEAHKKGAEYEYWEYLWYDAETKRAFFEEYSM
ncbi:MAG: hypothetical protein DI535_28400 [Citrobacter freundii]|nr:MAG: hypothetical protein DI535_28400 [Citrobacter freundii]